MDKEKTFPLLVAYPHSLIATSVLQLSSLIFAVSRLRCRQWSSLLTAVTPDATELVSPPPPPPPPPSGSAEQARQGNFLYSATRYLGWLTKDKAEHAVTTVSRFHSLIAIPLSTKF